ncbi:hypothetical protein EGW08_004608 [Elysia chlorotica]|uniref:Uncharacterized protein n=1 Tax=Elysia chlorotica TaxID=188477 RepID=A0A3S0ZWD3_ELYCH|nr:hypothetical protein EGW08_004608 [Elysia chlorotica]
MEDKGQALVWKIKNGELGDVKMFVEKEGIDVNIEVQGRLPLHYAADYGQTDVMEYLLSKGAKVNAEDKYGITPLLSAIFEGHTSSVKLLMEKGADKSGKAPDGASYIDCAESEDIKALLK